MLPAPICTNAADVISHALDDVRLIQLVLDEAGYAALRPFIGATVTLSGSLFAWHTGHHHAPLLMENVRRTSL